VHGIFFVRCMRLSADKRRTYLINSAEILIRRAKKAKWLVLLGRLYIKRSYLTTKRRPLKQTIKWNGTEQILFLRELQFLVINHIIYRSILKFPSVTNNGKGLGYLI